ncbi:hypothetical protein [Labrys wisconsinensis]|uniref:Class I SAM-dependent methyltransferase n=1 Tax=Labrys wisconsinensis TaxID=425677 RepID=A0ABU0J3A1_9HYPH|nr:hypothetical protein [Labrys wisconsinensis]MDQ0468745.1 hypothetical protein [Labrys wisconsinensis]
MPPPLPALLRETYDPATQISPAQIEAVASIVRARAPGARFLVFGLGRDSPMWQRLNADGETLFVEDKPAYVEAARQAMPQARIVVADYAATTVLGSFAMSPAALDAIAMPEELRGSWDVVLIDGPAGYWPGDPGRLVPLAWTSRLMARHTHVFVDDYNRVLERHFADLLIRFDNPPCAELAHEREAGKTMLWRIGRSLPP